MAVVQTTMACPSCGDKILVRLQDEYSNPVIVCNCGDFSTYEVDQ